MKKKKTKTNNKDKEPQWEKIKVKRMLKFNSQICNRRVPSIIFRLPSGFYGREIEVYEDPIDVLEVRYIYKTKKD